MGENNIEMIISSLEIRRKSYSATHSTGSDVILDKQVNSSSDDCRWNSPSFIYLTENYLPLSPNSFNSSMRFVGVTIPNGATITKSYLTLTAYDDFGGSLAQRIYCQQSSNASTFSTYSDASARIYCTNTATWSLPSMTAGSQYNTSDISSLIQELVDDYGGLSDAGVVFRFSPYSGTTQWLCYAWDGDSSKAPKLHIEYTTQETTTVVYSIFDETKKAFSKFLPKLGKIAHYARNSYFWRTRW